VHQAAGCHRARVAHKSPADVGEHDEQLDRRAPYRLQVRQEVLWAVVQARMWRGRRLEAPWQLGRRENLTRPAQSVPYDCERLSLP
jgi:hypothetical protein